MLRPNVTSTEKRRTRRFAWQGLSGAAKGRSSNLCVSKTSSVVIA
jgi:hypothetical protein